MNKFKVKYLLIIVHFFCFLEIGRTQNLVENASFEDTVNCPLSTGELSSLVSWSTFANWEYNAADYFNSCVTTGLNMPNTMVGFQHARTGEGMTGLIAGAASGFGTYVGANYREYLTSTLNTALTIGQKYYVSFYVSNSGYSFEPCPMAVNKLGLKFSTTQPSAIGPIPDNIAHVWTETIISDTSDWTRVFGTFIADSSYTSISIGNFFDSTNTTSLFLCPGGSNGYEYSYYFIDDVRVSTDSIPFDDMAEINNPSERLNVNIYPNPAKSSLTIENLNKPYDIFIYNSIGFLMYSDSNTSGSTQKIDLSEYEKGLIFIKIHTKDEVYSSKIVKQ
jgi:hypothetical protein